MVIKFAYKAQLLGRNLPGAPAQELVKSLLHVHKTLANISVSSYV